MLNQTRDESGRREAQGVSSGRGIEFQIEGGILTLCLSRPGKANALNIPMLAEAHDIICNKETMATANMVVITSSLERFFSAGADLDDFMQARRAQYACLRKLAVVLQLCTLPIISIVRGRVIGAGALFLALSDIVLFSEAATVEFPEIEFGMYPAFMHAVLAHKIAPQQLFQLLCAGKKLDAREAIEIGLATEILPATDFTSSSEERLRFYSHRLSALDVGRTLLQRHRVDDLERRLAEAEILIEDNLEDRDTRRILNAWLYRRGLGR